MTTNVSFEKDKSSLNPPSTLSAWLDSVDYEKIPSLGTYLLVDQLLNSPCPSLKQIKVAAKIIKSDPNINISIYPPSSSDPLSFIEKMVAKAMKMQKGSPYAEELINDFCELQASWNMALFLRFTRSWSRFTACYLQEKVTKALSTV